MQCDALSHRGDKSQASQSQEQPCLCLDSTHPPPQCSPYPNSPAAASWPAFLSATQQTVYALNLAPFRGFFLRVADQDFLFPASFFFFFLFSSLIAVKSQLVYMENSIPAKKPGCDISTFQRLSQRSSIHVAFLKT